MLPEGKVKVRQKHSHSLSCSLLTLFAAKSTAEVVLIEESDGKVHRREIDSNVTGSKHALHAEVKRVVQWRKDEKNQSIVKEFKTGNMRDAVILQSRGALLSGDAPYSHYLNKYGSFFSCMIDDFSNGIIISSTGACANYL